MFLFRKKKETVREDKKRPECTQLFLQGYNDYFFSVFSEMDLLDDNILKETGKKCRQLLSGKNAKEVIDQLYEYRKYAGYHYGKVPELDRLKSCCGKDAAFILMAGMLHINGYIREKSTALAADYPELLPFIIHRFNDWVEQVRTAAESSLHTALPGADIVTVIAAYAEAESLSSCVRLSRDAINCAKNEMGKRISAEAVITVIDRLRSSCSEVQRRKLCIPLIRDGLLSAETVEYIISSEKGNLSDSAALLYVSSGKVSTDKLREFTSAKLPKLRAKAVEQLYERNGLWDGAEKLLSDRTKGIREQMRFYFSKSSGLDLRTFYLEHLPEPEAIMGLGESGNIQDEDRILSFVSAQSSKTCSAAVYALSLIAGKKYSGLFYDMIFDSRPQVSKAAFRAYTRSGGYTETEKVYNAIISHSDDRLTVRRLVNILCSSGIWQAMPQLLRLYNWEDENIRRRVQYTVEGRSYYFTSSGKLAEKIKTAMNEAVLPENLVREIQRQLEKR